MLRLDHMNVVRCYSIPPGLDPGSTDLPSLCMEYCESGDLRRLLNKIENCRGLLESQILPVLNDVTSALGYLHNRRIIHRDLKPENVVLKSTQTRMVYKLIDLGYAKELGVSSLAKSFVGTLQYVAPELFLEQDYTKSVDYWSLGLLCHEIVTGQRPFLPHLSPGQWVDHVEQKLQNHIAVLETVDGKIVYQENLVPETRISRKLALRLEDWLRSLLDWSAERRGRDTHGNVVVFTQLNKILREKRLDVFNLRNKTVHCYAAETSFSFNHLQAQILADTNISAENQLLLTDHGYKITREDDLDQFTEAELPIFLVDMSSMSLKLSEQLKCVQFQIPVLVQQFLRDTKRSVQDYHLKLMNVHGYHFIAQECRTHELMAIGLKTLFSYIKTEIQDFSTLTFSQDLQRLEANMEFFTSSLNHDLSRYDEQAQKKDRITSVKMIESWNSSRTDILSSLDTLRTRTCILEESIKTAETGIREVERETTILDPPSDPALKELEGRSLRLYDGLRRERASNRVDTTPREIAQIVVRMLRRRDQLLNSTCSLLCKLRRLVVDSLDINQAAGVVSTSFQTLGESLIKAQTRRQSDIWTLLAAAIKYSPQSKDDKKPKQSDQLTVKHEKEEKQNDASENNNLDGKESLMNLPGINELNITKDEQETGSQNTKIQLDVSESEKLIEENEKIRTSLEQRMKVLEKCLQD
ncbi:inhibitor of nuclear factor kappa-B kinase subunit beta isoform X2 [Eurytemora carolleeae]|nr:inhibitor of nuclear factor kappa-B kinase subunit beta isoform X2 [Eurytemora carolleeae]|eukprot:XP_023335610.1 inhibitor of nuclear factor kappa-B kinase subunit beta-like isoform X2 [Eurytemora affinis]